MKRMILGIVIAQIVLYFFGFLYWGLGPYPTLIWKQAKNQDALLSTMKQRLPVNGTYFLPSTAGDAEGVDRVMRQGPVAMVHMLAVDGRPAMEPTIMIAGFCFNLVTIVLLAMLMRRFGAALPKYSDRVQFIAFAGLISAFFIDGGEVAWWMMPLDWKLYQGVYDALFWLIAALILARFVAPVRDAHPAT